MNDRLKKSFAKTAKLATAQSKRTNEAAKEALKSLAQKILDRRIGR
jgi:hypothetical protein